MMRIWRIPAKTFLLGEYAALQGGSALILTTKPCFELQLCEQSTHPFHPESPAGRLLNDHQYQGVQWVDPFNGLGGLGASSAEFLACFQVLFGKTTDEQLLDAYHQYAGSSTGLKPSGYDVLAQSRTGCVFINKNRHEIIEYTWPFKHISFLLIHTDKKVATHEHLRNQAALPDVHYLSELADQGKKAFEEADDDLLINTMNACYDELLKNNLVAPHTQTLINTLKKHPHILALKGCGALGADTVVMLVENAFLQVVKRYLEQAGHIVLADMSDEWRS